MAKIAASYIDNAGQHHPTPEQAVISDIASVLGRIGSDTGLAPGLASLILDKRSEIEMCFAELDALRGAL